MLLYICLVFSVFVYLRGSFLVCIVRFAILSLSLLFIALFSYVRLSVSVSVCMYVLLSHSPSPLPSLPPCVPLPSPFLSLHIHCIHNLIRQKEHVRYIAFSHHETFT